MINRYDGMRGREKRSDGMKEHGESAFRERFEAGPGSPANDESSEAGQGGGADQDKTRSKPHRRP